MGAIVRWLDRALYSDYGDNWDDTRFRALVVKHLRPQHVVLDLGAGAGIVAQMNFRGLVARTCGIDPDERVLRNPHLDQGMVATGEAIPYPDAYFDAVVCDNVLEHLRQPLGVLAEVARVLRPGGLFLAKTPNRAHYVAIGARFTPHWFHRLYNRWRGRRSDDTFPTVYRANTARAVRTLASAAGLSMEGISFLDGRPEYLRVSCVTYVFGWLYERLVTSRLAWLRPVMIVALRKPA